LNDLLRMRKMDDPYPCWSSEEAKREGVWVCDVTVTPREFTVEGKTYRLGEAWIEEAYDDGSFLVWFPKRYKLGWNRLCLRVPRYEDGPLNVKTGAGHHRFNTYYAGQHTMRLEAGDYPTVECEAQFWRWEPRKDIALGKVTLEPVLNRK
jgi:hypothetical protein